MLPKKRKNLTWYELASLENSFGSMSSQLEDHTFDHSYFQCCLPQIYRSVLKSFRQILQASATLNAIFISVIFLESLVFMFFAARSIAAALALAGLFLTCFSYLVLLFYYQAKKSEQLIRLKDQFLQACRQHISLPQGEAQHHLSIAEASLKFSSYLMSFEKNFYRTPPWMQVVEPWLSRLSSWFYWKDVFQMRQLLLRAAIEEHLKQVRMTPTDLEVHASLANSYVAQSLLYREPIILQDRKNRLVFEEQFCAASRFAIEEFRILSHYAPNDPWVHEQLARGYRQLDMSEEELAEVEILCKLQPQDKETLFRLGELYFRQGMNAKGLQIYEQLKQSHFKRAEELISSYGILYSFHLKSTQRD